MDETQRSLLDRLRDEPDGPSWRRLVDLYTPFLRRALSAQGITGADADDILQEVFSVLAAELPAFSHSGKTGAFRHWLRGVLRNRVRRFWDERQLARQRRANDPELRAMEEVPDPSNELDQLWDQEHNQWIARRLIELIEAEFQMTTWCAFRRQVVDQVQPRDVAAELGLSVNAVLIAKSRVLRRMRQELSGLTD